MIEQTVIGYLSDIVPTYAEEPETAPEEGLYCVVEKTGGGRNAPGIRDAMIAVQCYAPSLAAAAQLCEDVVAYMDGITALPNVSRCELNSSYNYTDDRKKAYRYQAVFGVVYY